MVLAYQKQKEESPKNSPLNWRWHLT
jgi:hypothetical protein